MFGVSHTVFNKPTNKPTPAQAPLRQAALAGDDDADAALVRRARDGSADAFRQLVERHDSRIYALVGRILGPGASQDDIDDTAQEIFVQVWRALPRFREEARFSTWLYRIATNQAIKQWHRVKRERQTVSEEELPQTVREALADLAPGPAAQAVLRARDRDLRGAIDALPEKQRTAILLHYFEEMSCEEIAALLGCSVGTVWSRLHYGCRRLRGTVGWLDEGTDEGT